MTGLEIITTEDGSHSLFNRQLNETYHSKHGAIQESIHVFIKNGLEFFNQQHPTEPVSIFEVGFGTGLNALLTLQYALNASCKISYTSVEAYPIKKEVWSQLNFLNSDFSLKKHFQRMHEAPWMTKEVIHTNFSLLKKDRTLQDDELLPGSYDLIFFDAFAPNKQPDMWTLTLLDRITRSMKRGGVFVTYCAKGQLKRDLKELGLFVEALPGPPGKREMVRAIKL